MKNFMRMMRGVSSVQAASRSETTTISPTTFASAAMVPDISIIIVNWNTPELLALCLNVIQATMKDLCYDIWVVDNGSTDRSVEIIRSQFPHVNLIENQRNLGFAGANNRAMSACRGRYMLLLNSDAFVTPGAVKTLFELAEREPKVALVGGQLLNLDGTFQAGYTEFPTLWREFMILSTLGRRLFGQAYPSQHLPPGRGPSRVDYVEGACLLVRRSAWQAVGGLDEGYFMYAEEVDWCYRMHAAGWQVWYQPAARIFHVGSASSRGRNTQREVDLYASRVRFFYKQRGKFAAQLLRILILGFTLLKVLGHALLRRSTGNRAGRQVASLPEVAQAMHRTLVLP
jgi:N-acetylglucosaminyl-diphospho-decaprenol L-rhamnosyltransferase